MRIPRVGELLDHARARLRGERRIAPYGVTGRVYERIREDAPAGAHQASARANATLEMKITRADGSIEIRTMPAKVTEQ